MPADQLPERRRIPWFEFLLLAFVFGIFAMNLLKFIFPGGS